MRIRILALLACGVVALGPGLVVVTTAPAQAAPGDSWPMCASPDDVRCISTATADGKPIKPAVAGVPRDYPWVRTTSDPGRIAFGVSHNPTGTGAPETETSSVDPEVTYRLVVRTDNLSVSEMTARTRSTTFHAGLDSVHQYGYEFAVQFKPTTVHHLSGGCAVGSCVDAPADLNLPGYAAGYVQNGSRTVPPGQLHYRTGTYRLTNAQDDSYTTDFAARSFTVKLANPSRTGTGAPASVYYSVFLPNSYLQAGMQVPYPGVVKGSSIIAVRTVGSTRTVVPVAATYDRAQRGVRVTFTSPASPLASYLIKARPTPPGKPRDLYPRKVAPHRVLVDFTKPGADGGTAVDAYRARCHQPRGRWHYSKVRSVGVVRVGSLPLGRITCQAKAHNARGWGRWSAEAVALVR